MEAQHQEGIASSSPSHEFSFTISLNPIPSKIPDNNYTNINKSITRNPNPLRQQPHAIELSPADDIFFHGHLLPFRHLSDVPVSPRSSTNSLDSFTLPIKELVREDNHGTLTSSVDDHHHPKTSSKLIEIHHQSKSFQEDNSTRLLLQEGKAIKEKSKSFSLFTNRKKPPLPRHHDQEKGNDRKGLQRKKSTFEILKRYLSSVKPFLSLRNDRKGNKGFDQAQAAGRPYSLSSGNLRVKNKKELRGNQGELSAPASMGASPTNSGRLIASGTISPIISKSDSTMEELQAAIQAAIAHCKKSIAAEDAIKFP